jgi:hypothetical protein
MMCCISAAATGRRSSVYPLTSGSHQIRPGSQAAFGFGMRMSNSFFSTGTATVPERCGRARKPSDRNSGPNAPLGSVEGDGSWPRFSVATSMAPHRGCPFLGAHGQQRSRAHHELGFRHVRFHGLLCDDVGMLIAEGATLFYSFFNVDQIFYFLLSIGMRPFVELSFMPTTLASGGQIAFHYRANVSPPKSYARSATPIRKLVAHWAERYGWPQSEGSSKSGTSRTSTRSAPSSYVYADRQSTAPSLIADQSLDQLLPLFERCVFQ